MQHWNGFISHCICSTQGCALRTMSGNLFLKMSDLGTWGSLERCGCECKGMFLPILFIIFSLFFAPIFDLHNACACMHCVPFGVYLHLMACTLCHQMHVMPLSAAVHHYTVWTATTGTSDAISHHYTVIDSYFPMHQSTCQHVVHPPQGSSLGFCLWISLR